MATACEDVCEGYTDAVHGHDDEHSSDADVGDIAPLAFDDEDALVETEDAGFGAGDGCGEDGVDDEENLMMS
jgi:hypothetical protein